MLLLYQQLARFQLAQQQQPRKAAELFRDVDEARQNQKLAFAAISAVRLYSLVALSHTKVG